MVRAGSYVPLQPWYSDGRVAHVLRGVSEVLKEQSLANDVENSNGLGAAVFKEKSVSSTLGMGDLLPFSGRL